MRTSEEIYHRVRWDGRFDPASFVLGVAQRGTVPKRIPLTRFTPGGDIPWHRVLFFEADGELVWDRSTGLDRIDATDSGRLRSPRRLPSPYFTARTAHRWHPERAAWEPETAPVPALALALPSPLSVLTWNTLWDRYDSERIDTARRRPLLLDALRAADADVIALQEAERPLLELLLGAQWVRENYSISTDPAGRDVADCGLLLLSRLPVTEAGLHALGPHKALAAMVVETPAGPVTFCATHLSSDHSANGAGRRDTELADLAAGLAAVEGELILLGDFNDGSDTPQSRLGMSDAWSAVHGPSDDTATFDPGVNPLAAVASLSGRASRLDRVLIRPGGPLPRAAALLGDVPAPDGLYVSDHYGVRVELAPTGAPTGLPATDRTVLALLPPDGPRVDLLPRFVPESSFEAAAALIAGACPAPASALPALFPLCHPSPAAPAPATGKVAMLSRRADEPPRVRATIDLATGTVHWLPEPAAPQPVGPAADPVATARLIAEAFPEGVVHTVGSRRMGCALPDADLDLVAALPGTVALSAVREQLARALPEASGIREVTGARVPGLRFHVDGLPVDLTTVATGPLPPAEAVARRTELGEAAATALSAVSDADAVLAAAEPHRAAFTELAREVKAWARARGLDSAPCGGLPGLAWSVMAAHTAHEAGDLPQAELLRHFFATWAAWDWRRPVPAAEGAPRLPMTVLTPTAPVRPCSQQVTEAGRDLLTRELFRAWELLETTPDADLRTPPPLHRRHAAWAVLSLRPGPDEGRFRGRLLTLLAALAEAGAPDAHAWPRPLTADATHVRYAIGLGATPPDEARLAAIGTRLLRGIPGAVLHRADGGEVPSLPRVSRHSVHRAGNLPHPFSV